MHHAAPLAASRENFFAVLASSARNRSDAQLSSLAAGSGAVALAAVLFHHASWMLLAACYVVWCFAGWGVMFRSAIRRSLAWRALETTIVASATIVGVSLALGVFFWALGSHWQL